MKLLLCLSLLSALTISAEPEKDAAERPLKALLITGGCCHDYEFQSKALTLSSEAAADIKWTVVNKGKGKDAQIELYNDPNWAKPYDVVVHNECFANTKDLAYIQKILDGHKDGIPAVVVHCAMHTYRAMETDEWRKFLGVTSKHHEHQSNYPVHVEKSDHPIMKKFPADWVTPKDELYIIEKTWPNTTVLATSKSEKSKKPQPVIWTNDYHGTRVFGTSYGHSNGTFGDQTFLDLLTNGILWSAGRLE